MHGSQPMELNSEGITKEDNAGITRRGKPGKPVTSKTCESFSDMIANSSNLCRRFGKRQESALIELWDS